MSRGSAASAASSPIALIAAVDREGAIGRGGALPWHLPADFAHFRRHTIGQAVLMGRRTFESIGRALPSRRNLVLSRRSQMPTPDLVWIAEARDAARHLAAGERLWVIGGAELYRLFLPHADQMLLTHVGCRIDDADAYFPEVTREDWEAEWLHCQPVDARHAHACAFVRYRRRKPPRPGWPCGDDQPIGPGVAATSWASSASSG